MGEFLPQLIDEGKEPRVMLEYSGTLFHGLRAMGLNDVFDALKNATCNPAYRRAVEWPVSYTHLDVYKRQLLHHP